MGARYRSDVSPLRYMPVYGQAAILALLTLAMAIVSAVLSLSFSGQAGEGGWAASMYIGMAQTAAQARNLFASLSLICAAASYFSFLLLPDAEKIAAQVRFALYNPARGNLLHLQNGELLPRVDCKRLESRIYILLVSAQQGVDTETIAAATPSISAALTDRFQQFAVTVTDIDVAFSSVFFTLEDVKVDRSYTFVCVEEMRPPCVTQLQIDQTNSIDLTTSGSILVAGKTRSGKTTGVISLLLQVLLCGPDHYGSQVIIIDPKQAELSRCPHTVTLDADGEATAILSALKSFEYTIRARQRILNDLSEACGDAVKCWDAGFRPSFLFIDEYVSCRTLFPKKPEKDSDYCLDTFDAVLKRIVTMGASAGCFVIISIAEASVQDGGLPAMLRSAMSTKVLFRPTIPEGRLLWDPEKLENFPAGRVYGPGDAWFSSTDGVHDAVTYVHFPHLEFLAYRELGRLLDDYYAH